MDGRAVGISRPLRPGRPTPWTGQLRGGMPYPDACRVLESKFPVEGRLSMTVTNDTSILASASQAGVQRIAHRVADQAERDDRGDQDDGRRGDEPPIGATQVVEPAGEHGSPVRVRGRQPESKK